MQKFFGTLWLSILAGICIGIGGTVYLSVENRIVGSFLFSIGLTLIVTNGFNLFTGKVGYLLGKKLSYLGELLIIWVGNFIGTATVAFLVKLTRLEILSTKLTDVKLNDNLLSVFILSIFCGMLMFLAVNGYKKVIDPVGKYLSIILPVMVFLLSGFEHCIGNMFFFSVSGVFTLKSLLYLTITTFGNLLGSLVFNIHNVVKQK